MARNCNELDIYGLYDLDKCFGCEKLTPSLDYAKKSNEYLLPIGNVHDLFESIDQVIHHPICPASSRASVSIIDFFI